MRAALWALLGVAAIAASGSGVAAEVYTNSMTSFPVSPLYLRFNSPNSHTISLIFIRPRPGCDITGHSSRVYFCLFCSSVLSSCPPLPPRTVQSVEADAEAEFELDSEVDSSSHHSHSISHAHSHAHKQPYYQYPSTAISSHSYLDTLASPVVIRGAAGTGLSPLNIDAWRYATTPQLNMVAAAATSTTVLPQFELRAQLQNNEAEVFMRCFVVVV